MVWDFVLISCPVCFTWKKTLSDNVCNTMYISINLCSQTLTRDFHKETTFWWEKNGQQSQGQGRPVQSAKSVWRAPVSGGSLLWPSLGGLPCNPACNLRLKSPGSSFYNIKQKVPGFKSIFSETLQSYCPFCQKGMCLGWDKGFLPQAIMTTPVSLM